MKLSDKALLVQLQISRWTARKFDRKATEDVAIKHGTVVDVGRYNKSLLPMNDMLDQVNKKATAIREKFYKNTLPWGINGTQILPSANYLSFMTEFRKDKSDYQWLVGLFVDAYPDLQQDAQRFLGSLYNPSDYPSVDEIANRFKIDMAVFPVPSDDFRTNIADDELQRIQSDVQQRVEQAAHNAMQDAWQRLYDRVKHLADKLNDPKATFKNSTVEHITELCQLLPRLNFADDPNLEAMRLEVERKLVGHHPDALRNDPDLRRDKAQEANDIMAKMGAFMGAN